MARKKAAVIAISSLCTLNKVTLPNHSFIPLKSLVLLNNLNTWAAEERLDFHSNGHSNPETPLNSQQYSGDFGVSGGGFCGTTVNHQNQYVQNGYYNESSQQISSGVYGADNPHKVDGQRSDSGDHYYGGMGHGSSNSSWQSGIPSQNSYDSFQHGGFRDQQNVGLASTGTPYSSHTQGNYSVGNTMPQQIYGDYQSGNYVQNANVMPEVQSSDDNSPHGTLEDLDTYCQDGKIREAVEMYARCGSMDDAYTVFSKMSDRNLTSWDGMISGYARNGLGEEAIDTFTRFKEAGLKPDGQMFIAVFNACSVTGDVVEGMLHFESMKKVYDIVPTMKHYVSIVNMLGSCGYLDEAFEFVERMPVEPSVDVWEALMDLCRVQGNYELGDRCAGIVEQLDPSRLTKGGLVPVKASKEKKKSGQTSLELRSKIHEYRAGDKSHPENDRIYALLRGMKEQMKEAGYVPDCRFVLHDIDQEGKEEALMAHSERLATAYGLITSSARSPIRIIKNLRVCVDCHNALKIVSKLVGRELVMRDAKRFHHMKDGKCSCNDYW